MAPEQTTQTQDAFARSYYSPSDANPQQPPQAAAANGAKPPMQPYAAYPGAYGQPFTPYQQMPVPMPLQRAEVPVNKLWENAKLALHASSIVFGIIAMGLSLSLLRSSWSGAVFNSGTTPMAVVCIIWSLAELITRWVRKWERGIHPGAHVALSLLIWLGAALVAGMDITLLIIDDRDRDRYSPYDDDYYSWDYDYYDSDYLYGRQRPIAKAATAFTLLLWLVHFILFVGACVDTAKRNAAARRPVMMVPAWGPPPNGLQPMPQQQTAAVPNSANIPMQDRSSTAAPPSQFAPSSDSEAERGLAAPKSPQPAAQGPPQRVPTVTEYYTPGTTN